MISIGPWVAEGKADWKCPEGADMGMDVRPDSKLPGFGFFRSQEPLGGEYVELDDSDKSATAIADRLSLREKPAAVDSGVSELLWELMTLHADPDSLTMCPPIMPGKTGVAELWIGDRLKRKAFDPAGPEWPKVQQLIWQQYRTLRAKAEAGVASDDAHLKQLTYWQEKFNLPTAAFIPVDLPVELPRPHGTTNYESFNKADGNNLGPDLTWKNWATAYWRTLGSQAIVGENNTVNVAYYTDWVTTWTVADFRVRITVVALTLGSNGFVSAGVCGRRNDDEFEGFVQYYATRIYIISPSTYKIQTYKQNGASGTHLGDYALGSIATPYDVKFTLNGSSLITKLDNVERINVTDTLIGYAAHGGTYGTLVNTDGSVVLDDMYLSDNLTDGDPAFALPIRRNHFAGLIGR